MGQTINGLIPWSQKGFEQDFESGIIGKNSEVFTQYDPVKASSGVLAVAGTTDAILGVAMKTVTMAATNQTVAKVTPSYLPVTTDMIFLMGTNGDLTGNATDVGTYYKLTGATGAVQIDQASGVQTTTSRVVMIVKVDPYNEGGTGSGSGLRKALVKVVKASNFVDN